MWVFLVPIRATGCAPLPPSAPWRSVGVQIRFSALKEEKKKKQNNNEDKKAFVLPSDSDEAMALARRDTWRVATCEVAKWYCTTISSWWSWRDHLLKEEWKSYMSVSSNWNQRPTWRVHELGVWSGLFSSMLVKSLGKIPRYGMMGAIETRSACKVSRCLAQTFVWYKKEKVDEPLCSFWNYSSSRRVPREPAALI